MPPRDFDLLNHIVEQLHNDLHESSLEQSNEQTDEPSSVERESEGHS
jgi:hypothetical protein